jgi:superfamily II DNA or RNA helicase
MADGLVAAIRGACSSTTWSRGVELARSGAVTLVSRSARELELRVSTRAGMIAPLVTLFVDDDEWSCECNSTEDACAHAAAAAIAFSQAERDGTPLVAADAPAAGGRIVYRFEKTGDQLGLRRLIVHQGGEFQLDGTMAAVAQGKLRGPKFVATSGDLRFERKLGSFMSRVLARHEVAKVFDALAGDTDVRMGKDAVTLGAPICGLRIDVRKTDGGWLAKLEPDPDVTAIYGNGVLRRGDKLHPLGGHGLPEGEYDELKRGRWFTEDETASLAGDTIPRWRRSLPVAFDPEAMPDAKVLRPRLHLATQRSGNALDVLATIVYGDPPVARIDGDRLTMLVDGGDVPLRNPRLEKLIVTRMRTELGLEPGVRGTMPAAEAIAWSSRVRGLDDVATSSRDHEQFFAAGGLTPSLHVDALGGFTLDFTSEGSSGGASADGKRASAAAVIRAWNEGETHVALDGGGFGELPADWLARHGARVTALLRAKEANARELPAWATADLASLCASLEQPPPPQWERLRGLFESFTGLGPPTLPPELDATLRDYQLEGVAWLQFLRRAGLGALLADDMGLGKTLQTICALSGRTLVVAPTSVLPNWLSELRRFRPTLRAATYHGPQRVLDPTADVVVTTYAILRLDQDVLAAQAWDTVVLDEAQAIKNADSKAARAAFALRADFRVALTGTPVENRLDDLWSQLHFTNPGLLGGRGDFGTQWGKPIAAGDAAAAASLRERIRPFVLRRLKRDVARELPPRTDVVLHCELRNDERVVYDTVRAATRDEVTQRLGAGEQTLAILEALLRLRQAACASALVPGTPASPLPSSKIETLLDALETARAGGHKALVFSQWTSMLDLVEPQLAARDLAWTRLDGSTRDRGEVVARFSDPDGPPVMLISLRAGGTGLNLVAADHVFLLDPWWNPAVEDQAADRAHRIGQDKPVFVHRLVARGTVEEGILALQTRKRELAQAAVDGGAAVSITKDELLALLDAS